MFNHQIGQIFFNNPTPRSLQDIEKGLVFELDILEKISRINKLIYNLSELIKKHELECLMPLFKIFDAYYTLKFVIPDLKPLDIFLGADSNHKEELAIKAYLEALDFALSECENYDFLAFNEKINSLLNTNPLLPGGNIRTTLIAKNISWIPVYPEKIKSALDELYVYGKKNFESNVFIKAALIYYQMLEISPFLVGNHRQAGIILATFFRKESVFPIYPISLSFYFYHKYQDYRNTLNKVRSQEAYSEWIEFFLKGIETTLSYYLHVFRKIIAIKEKSETLLSEAQFSRTIKNNLKQILSFFSERLIANIKDVCLTLNKTYPTVASGVKLLEEMGIIVPINSNHRNRKYFYSELFRAIFNDATID